jgi:tRNA-specific 2-thiouridylase
MLLSKKKVFVALSGGVDSSVAALLLKKAANPVEFFKLTGRPAPRGLRGMDVYAGFIRGYNIDGCQDRDLEDARSVAQHLGIPFYVFDLEEEYKRRVVDYLLEGYRKGITPNPDVVCNSQIKFGLFYEKAREAGADYVASGHYARVKHPLFTFRSQCSTRVFAGTDADKDQSYFLWQVPRERFERILFPLGKLTKKQVRTIAWDAKLPTAEKKDSQGVCFLGKFRFDEFLKEHIKPKKGDIVDTTGRKVGEHDGVWFYTIGQGHGLTNTAGRRFYVVRKDVKRNRLIVAYEGDAMLRQKEVSLTNLNFLDAGFERRFARGDVLSVLARVRYRQPLFEATLQKSGDGKALLVADREEKLFPASGQSAVFYSKKEQMLGGGIIV